jgi:replicative DNA helicase
MEIDRVQPQNIELEISLLNTLIFEQDTEILDTLRQEHFYRTAHQKIFKACKVTHSKENTLDIQLIKSELGADCDISLLGKISESPPAINAESYCKRLISLFKLRKLIELSNAVSKRSYSAKDDEAESVVDFVACELSKISDGIGGGWCGMQDVISECIDHCEKIQKKQGITGVPSGFADLDYYTAGFHHGDLVIIAARPGCGKTAFVINSSKNSARSGYNNGFQSLEMSKVPIGNRFLSVVSRVNSLKFRSGRFTDNDWDLITGAADKLTALPIWIDDRPRASIKDIQKNARALKSKHGLDILWIDYLGFVEGDKSSRSKVIEVETITRGCKELAKELQIPVVLLSQLNRECEKRDNKRPQLSDLRDSGAIEQDADLVLFLYRDEKYYPETTQDKGIVEVEISKQRNGPTGRVKLKWQEEYTRMDSLQHERS